MHKVISNITILVLLLSFCILNETKAIIDSTVVNARIASDGTAQFGNVQRVLLRNTFSSSVRNEMYDAELQALYVYGEQAKVVTENDLLCNINMGIDTYENSSILLFGTYESSRLRRIQHRYQIGVGPKYIFSNTISSHWTGSVVCLLDRTTFESSEELSSNRISLRIKGRQSIIEKKLILSTEMFYQPSLSDFTNDFRWRSNTRFEIPVSQSIAITSSVTYSYESITRLGRLPGDTALTFGFMVQLL